MHEIKTICANNVTIKRKSEKYGDSHLYIYHIMGLSERRSIYQGKATYILERMSDAGKYVRKIALCRLWLPYGKWTFANGREILFNRHYEPIFERTNGNSAIIANHDEYVKDIQKEEWYYDDSCVPCNNKRTFNKCLKVLREFGIDIIDISKCNYILERINTANVEA